MTKVIIIGNNLVNTLGLIRSIGEKGYPVFLFLEPVRKSLCYVRYSKYITKIHYLESIEQTLDILLSEYACEKEKPIVLCGGDSSIRFLDEHYDVLKDRFHIFNCGEQGKISWYLDKINTFPIAEECGFNLIKTWHVNNTKKIPDDITYPCLIKGNNSTNSTKGDIFICKDFCELKNKLHDGIDYLIQEYIHKEFEIDIVGFSYDQGKKVFAPAVVRKIRDEFQCQSMYIRLDDINEYKDFNPLLINRLLGKIKYEGIFSIELLYSKGKYHFLEINLRNDGTGWLYSKAGINYPYLWVLYSVGDLSSDMIKSIKFKNHLYLMQENDLFNIIRGKLSVVQWIKDFYHTKAFFIANGKDPMPFVFSTWIHIKQFFKLVLRKTFHINIQ